MRSAGISREHSTHHWPPAKGQEGQLPPSASLRKEACRSKKIPMAAANAATQQAPVGQTAFLRPRPSSCAWYPEREVKLLKMGPGHPARRSRGSPSTQRWHEHRCAGKAFSPLDDVGAGRDGECRQHRPNARGPSSGVSRQELADRWFRLWRVSGVDHTPSRRTTLPSRVNVADLPTGQYCGGRADVCRPA